MSSLNKVMLIGRLGKDPEIRTTPSGIKVANLSIATSEKWKGNDGNPVEKTEWHRCTAWRGLADVIEKYVKKGDQIYVEGRIETKEYEKDGVKRYSTEISVQQMTMLGGKRAPSDAAGGSVPSAPEDDLPF